MSFSINAFDHARWQQLGLQDYADFADKITTCNEGEDAFSSHGEWYYIPEARLPNNDVVIYFGSWGNDNSPGASAYTNAEIFDMNDPSEVIEYASRANGWEACPDYLD